MKKNLLLVMLSVIALSVGGCWWDNCSPSSGGFTVRTVDKVWPNCSASGNGCGTPTLLPTTTPRWNVQVSGEQNCDFSQCGPDYYLGSTGSVYGFGLQSWNQSPVFTDQNGKAYIANGRVNAQWTGNVLNWPPDPHCLNFSTTGTFNIYASTPTMQFACLDSDVGIVGPIPNFVLSGSSQSTITMSNPNLTLTTSSGMPGLWVYNHNGMSIAEDTALSTSSCPDFGVQPLPPVNQPQFVSSSVSPNGTSATFPFPTLHDGSALPPGFYTFNLWNQSSPGKYADVGMGMFSVGSNDKTHTTPYGVDSADITVWGQSCYYDDTQGYVCYPYGPGTTPAYLITLSSTGQVNFSQNDTAVINVGSQPTAIKGYRSTTVCITTDPYGGNQCTQEPPNAIVTNFGSNTVSILDLVNNAVLNTISVGTQPIAVALNNPNPASATKAYVANYGSSSVSEIDLSANTQSRVAGVGARPEALALDPNGSALWVGGLNYIYKISLSNLSVIQSFSVSGQVTSLAISGGQNSLVYTTVSTSGGSTNFQAQQASLSNFAVQGTYAQYTMSSSSYYAEAITSGGPAPGAPGWLMSANALVSANYGNSIVVVGTPTGFAVLDLIRQITLFQGSTPTAVRGIASDPAQGVAYLTAPDSNSLITVPLPAYSGAP